MVPTKEHPYACPKPPEDCVLILIVREHRIRGWMRPDAYDQSIYGDPVEFIFLSQEDIDTMPGEKSWDRRVEEMEETRSELDQKEYKELKAATGTAHE